MTDTHAPFATCWIRQQLTCGQMLDREQVRALLAAYEDALARLKQDHDRVEAIAKYVESYGEQCLDRGTMACIDIDAACQELAARIRAGVFAINPESL